MINKIIKLISKYNQIFLIAIVLWCILNESISISSIIQGIIVGLITALSLNRLLGDNNHYANKENFSFLTMLRYYFVLLIAIYKATFRVIKIIIFDNPTPQIVRYRSNIKNPWERSLIANSITLTPGTVTINDNLNEVTVLWLKPTTTDICQYRKTIQGDFEKVFDKEGN